MRFDEVKRDGSLATYEYIDDLGRRHLQIRFKDRFLKLRVSDEKMKQDTEENCIAYWKHGLAAHHAYYSGIETTPEASAALISPRPTSLLDYQGFLFKKGGGKVDKKGEAVSGVFDRTNWTKKFFFLDGPLLKYYEDSEMKGKPNYEGDLTAAEVSRDGVLATYEFIDPKGRRRLNIRMKDRWLKLRANEGLTNEEESIAIHRWKAALEEHHAFYTFDYSRKSNKSDPRPAPQINFQTVPEPQENQEDSWLTDEILSRLNAMDLEDRGLSPGQEDIIKRVFFSYELYRGELPRPDLKDAFKSVGITEVHATAEQGALLMDPEFDTISFILFRDLVAYSVHGHYSNNFQQEELQAVEETNPRVPSTETEPEQRDLPQQRSTSPLQEVAEEPRLKTAPTEKKGVPVSLEKNPVPVVEDRPRSYHAEPTVKLAKLLESQAIDRISDEASPHSPWPPPPHVVADPILSSNAPVDSMLPYMNQNLIQMNANSIAELQRNAAEKDREIQRLISLVQKVEAAGLLKT